MLVNAPELAALLQTVQPTQPLLNALEGYKDLESVMAVMESQQSFDITDNTFRFKEDNGPVPMPDETNRIRHLGFFLTEKMNLNKPIEVKLSLGGKWPYTPLVMLLKAFNLVGEHKPRLMQPGLSLQDEAMTNQVGNISFAFEPLANLLKDPRKITGFDVYLIRPKQEQRPNPPIAELLKETETPEETGIVRASPHLNVYKKIDTRV